MILRVELNGTDVNPYHRWGLTQNPFPQIPKAEITAHLLRLASLGGDPIPNVEYIRERLAGFSKEFVDLCCAQFQPGKMVVFTVRFPD